MDLREIAPPEVQIHDDDTPLPHLQPSVGQHSLLDVCDQFPLPTQVYTQKTAKRIYRALTKVPSEFPHPTPTTYLQELIQSHREDIIALWRSSVRSILPTHGYRKSIEGHLESKHIAKVDKALYTFLLTSVLWWKWALMTEDQKCLVIPPAVKTHAYLMEQIDLVPPPSKEAELPWYWRNMELLGVIPPLFVRQQEREMLWVQLQVYMQLAQILRLHPDLLAKRPLIFTDTQRKYNGAIFSAIAQHIPDYTRRWLQHVAESYCYRMQDATMIKQHKHYQGVQKAYGASPFEGAILLREMLVVDYFQHILGEQVIVKRASNYDDKEYGVDMIVYTPSLWKVGFFDVTFDPQKIDEKKEKVAQLVSKNTYQQTEFYNALTQTGRQPMCHVTWWVIYIDYEAFLVYLKDYLLELSSGSTIQHLRRVATQYPATKIWELFPIDKQAKKLLTMQKSTA